MKFDLVVAQYKENLDWIREIDRSLLENIFVYTKSDRSEDVPATKRFYLANVGRESHTYISHVVNNWDAISSGSSSDFIFFVQGGPHDMGPRNIMEWIKIVSEDDLDHTYNFRMCSPNEFLSDGRCSQWAGQTKPANCGVMDWCRRHVNPEPSEIMPIFWNACFGVSRRLIALSDRHRYVKIMQDELSDINPECGHYCERLWYYIFNMDKARTRTPSDSYMFFGGHDGEKHHGTVRLKPDGTVGMYSHFNETFWSIEGDSLILYNGNKKPTSILRRISETEYSGAFLENKNITHRLKLSQK